MTTEEPTALTTTAEDEQGQEVVLTRQAPIDIYIVSPSGANVLIPQVNPVDPVSLIKQAITELQETAAYSNYHFELNGAPVSDYLEIAVYAPVEDASMTLTMVSDLYDVRKARLQLKRVRDIIAVPPVTRSASTNSQTSEGHDDDEAKGDEKGSAEVKSEEADDAAKEKSKGKLPVAEEVFAVHGFEKFYEEVLLRTGHAEPSPLAGAKAPSDVVKSVALSGWNPPSAGRKVQGDILYIEAADEGIFHITATPHGFFVNKSTRYVFDAAPAVNAHFSHELLYTLMGASAGLRTAWAALCTATEERDSTTSKHPFGPLDAIVTLYNQGREDQLSNRLQWNTPPTGLFAGDKGHTFDLGRTHEDLADGFGIDENGAPREWYVYAITLICVYVIIYRGD
jgi:protein TIF31